MKKLLLLPLILISSTLAGLNLDTAIPVSTKSIKSYLITKLEVDISNRLIYIMMDAKDGDEVLSSDTLVLEGADYTSALGVTPNVSLSIEKNVAAVLYAKIMSKKVSLVQ